ncbi:MAG: NYN domain-containing protein [Gemmatimonadota bacterium]
MRELIGSEFHRANDKYCLFIDGENFAIRAKMFAEQRNVPLIPGRFYRENVYAWIPHQTPLTFLQNASGGAKIQQPPFRSHYYTSVQGDSPSVETVQETLWGLSFQPRVFKKTRQGKSKGVDIALTTEFLTHSFQHTLDVACLVAGDGDYVPMVEAAKQRGRRVLLIFFGKEGLNAELRRAADHFLPIDELFVHAWMDYAFPAHESFPYFHPQAGPLSISVCGRRTSDDHFEHHRVLRFRFTNSHEWITVIVQGEPFVKNAGDPRLSQLIDGEWNDVNKTSATVPGESG